MLVASGKNSFFHELEAEIFLTFAGINYLHFTIYIVLHGSSIIL